MTCFSLCKEKAKELEFGLGVGVEAELSGAGAAGQWDSWPKPAVVAVKSGLSHRPALLQHVKINQLIDLVLFMSNSISINEQRTRRQHVKRPDQDAPIPAR